MYIYIYNWNVSFLYYKCQGKKRKKRDGKKSQILLIKVNVISRWKSEIIENLTIYYVHLYRLTSFFYPREDESRALYIMYKLIKYKYITHKLIKLLPSACLVFAFSLLENLIIIITRKILEFAKVREKKFVNRENCPGTFEFYVAISSLSLSLSLPPISTRARVWGAYIRAGTFEEGEKVDARETRGPMSFPGNIIIGRYFRFYGEKQKQLLQNRCRQSGIANRR